MKTKEVNRVIRRACKKKKKKTDSYIPRFRSLRIHDPLKEKDRGTKGKIVPFNTFDRI